MIRINKIVLRLPKHQICTHLQQFIGMPYALSRMRIERVEKQAVITKEGLKDRSYLNEKQIATRMNLLADGWKQQWIYRGACAMRKRGVQVWINKFGKVELP